MPLPILPVLAAADVIGLIILVLSVLGWFVKAIKDQQQKAPKPQARRNNPEQVRTEIQDFLDELSGAPPKRPPARQAPPQRPPERPRPPAAKTVNKKPAKPAPAAPSKKPAKPVATLADKHLGSSDLGSGLRTHVSSYMTDRVEQEARQDVPNRIAADVQADVGSSRVAAVVTSLPPHPLVTLLRDPRGVRQAIVMQEILQKPKALRHEA